MLIFCINLAMKINYLLKIKKNKKITLTIYLNYHDYY